MDYPSEFQTRADIQANQRQQQWAREALKPAGPNATEAEVLREMRALGGNFVQHLMNLWDAADDANREIIRQAWPHTFREYATKVHYSKLAIEADRASRN
ncbi:hypothetical protein [Achromobacter xylosoxidans]|uniref:Uncharacterized protein n=1 Tax=Alcaligenes xylosoxydans xylosoxydans TaxID=85698 RepID=A0A1R1JSP3_ALCXX|nr:hypothetical protein [Achromobacter xylosoxidans]OMG85417.1 hypothetical protein BIZ92_27100 [Achromobacter xylosoxidans]